MSRWIFTALFNGWRPACRRRLMRSSRWSTATRRSSRPAISGSDGTVTRTYGCTHRKLQSMTSTAEDGLNSHTEGWLEEEANETYLGLRGRHVTFEHSRDLKVTVSRLESTQFGNNNPSLLRGELKLKWLYVFRLRLVRHVWAETDAGFNGGVDFPPHSVIHLLPFPSPFPLFFLRLFPFSPLAPINHISIQLLLTVLPLDSLFPSSPLLRGITAINFVKLFDIVHCRISERWCICSVMKHTYFTAGWLINLRRQVSARWRLCRRSVTD